MIALAVLGAATPSVLAGHLPENPAADFLFGVDCVTVTGSVLEEGSTDGIEAITILAVATGPNSALLGYAETQTDVDGEYELVLRTYGDYAIFAFDDASVPPRYLPVGPEELTFTSCGDTADLPFALQPVAGRGDILVSLQERLTVSGTQPLAGQSVTLELQLADDTFVPLANASTDAAGAAAFRDLPRGQQYRVAFLHEDWQDQSVVEELTSRELSVAWVANRTLVAVTGTVTDTSSEDGVAGVLVAATHPQFCPAGTPAYPEFVCQATTGADGGYTLNLPWHPVDYSFQASLFGYVGATRAVSVPAPSAGSPGSGDFDLDRTRAELSGTVLDGGSGLAGAEICLTGIAACTLTSSNGEYAIRVKWGTYDVTITAPDPSVDPFVSTAFFLPPTGATLDHDFTPTTGKIEGTVLDALSVGPLPVLGATVAATDNFAVVFPCTTNALTGAFLCSNLPPGDYDLSASAAGFEDLTNDGPHSVVAGVTTPHDLLMDRNATAVLHGVIGQGSVAGNPPLAGATVRIEGTGTTVDLTTTSDGAGEYSFTNLPWDTYNITVSLTTYITNETNGHELEDGGDLQVDINLNRTLHKLLARVVDGSVPGTPPPVSGVEVTATGVDNKAVATVTTDATGMVDLELPWGDYDLEFAHDSYDSSGAPADGTILPGLDLNLGDVELTRLLNGLAGVLFEDRGIALLHNPAVGYPVIASATFDITCTGSQVGEQLVTGIVSDADGNYTTGDVLPWDDYECEAGITDPAVFGNATTELTLPPTGTLKGADFLHERVLWRVHGTVLNALTAEPVPNLRVCIANVNAPPAQCQDTTIDGEFERLVPYVPNAPGLPRTNVVVVSTVGTVGVYFPAANFAVIGPDAPSPDEPTDLSVMPQDPAQVPRPGFITGGVVDQSLREPVGVPGITVTATRATACPGAGDSFSAVTDINGTFRITTACSGVYDVSYAPPTDLYGTPASIAGVAVADLETVDVGVVGLDRALVDVEVSVLDLLNMTEPVGDAAVTLVGIDVDVERAELSNATTGVAKFIGVPWGVYNATAVAPDGDGWLLNESSAPALAAPTLGGNATVYLAGPPPATPECAPEAEEEPQVCDPSTSSPLAELVSLDASKPGDWLVIHPQLGVVNVTTGSTSANLSAGPHDGTWIVVFRPSIAPDALPVAVTASYTNSTGDAGSFDAQALPLFTAAMQTIHAPLVWVFNLHTEGVAACLPTPANTCTGADAAELGRLRFFTPDA